ncbi:DUF4236 domain-containing protein [Streptomyces sp. NPDC056112]|uniref:DUF4236 domain-containing protein n=1 Tax=Streptomyces sp. NPDC056112 TaxID=3345715 RepID=UPI0035E122BC
MSPITFRKSFRILPWLRVTINRRSWSWTVGGKTGPHYTHNSNGRTTTSWNLPGPFGYRSTRTRRTR